MVSVRPGLVTPAAQQLLFYYLLNTKQAHHFVNTPPPKKAALHSHPFTKTSTETSNDKVFQLQIQQILNSRLVALRMVKRLFCIQQMLNLTTSYLCHYWIKADPIQLFLHWKQNNASI